LRTYKKHCTITYSTTDGLIFKEEPDQIIKYQTPDGRLFDSSRETESYIKLFYVFNNPDNLEKDLSRKLVKIVMILMKLTPTTIMPELDSEKFKREFINKMMEISSLFKLHSPVTQIVNYYYEDMDINYNYFAIVNEEFNDFRVYKDKDDMIPMLIQYQKSRSLQIFDLNDENFWIEKKVKLSELELT
jgi:hypothetical protein